MFVTDVKCSQTVPNSRTGSAKASVSKAVVRTWHRTHVIRGRPKGSSSETRWGAVAVARAGRGGVRELNPLLNFQPPSLPMRFTSSAPGGTAMISMLSTVIPDVGILWRRKCPCQLLHYTSLQV